ncbi:GIY-YIG nuclease family protein [Daejeonella sp.]|uniref:GIY-YIG nuclease family protein n=1 Tax=Daejeonella sp. TaxID=2805397 RepID=UPI0039834ED8
MFTVYALQSSVDGRIYVGFSSDVNKRLIQHNSGKTKSTKGFRPWAVIYTLEVERRDDARKKEIYFKSGYGKEFLKALVLSFKESNTCLPAGREPRRDHKSYL